MNFRNKAVLFLATGCFTGYIRWAPGTFGSLLGLPLCWVLSGLSLKLALPLTLIFMLVAIVLSQAAEKILDQKDPGCIVIDEIAGLLVTFIGLPFTFSTALAGFCVFRAMDITKPFPIRVIESNLPGGSGVVIDDVAAGIYSNIVVRILLVFIHLLK
jgi:phosphatidylglycerophosphatase A